MSTYRARAGRDAAAVAVIALTWGVMTLQVLSFDDLGPRIVLMMQTFELSLPLAALCVGVSALSVALLREWGKGTTRTIRYPFVLIEVLSLALAGWTVSRRTDDFFLEDLTAATAVTVCLLVATTVARGLGTRTGPSKSGADVHIGLLSPLVAFVVLTAVAYLVAVSQGEMSGRAVGALAMVAVFWLSSTQVSITDSTLFISLTPLLWTYRSFKLDEIDVEAVQGIEPLAFLGWGIRGTRRRRAIVLRRGEGLEIVASRERLIITVSDAHKAAGIAKALRHGAMKSVVPPKVGG